MNTKLKFLFDRYSFSKKDRFEIEQFYSLLSDSRKQNFLDNFENFAIRLQKIDEDIKIEKELLISDAVNEVRKTILKNRNKNLDKKTKKEIDSLKGEL